MYRYVRSYNVERGRFDDKFKKFIKFIKFKIKTIYIEQKKVFYIK